MPRLVYDPASRGRVCAECRELVGVLWMPQGGYAVIDAPVLDPERGWVAPPHICRASLERVRRELMAPAPAVNSGRSGRPSCGAETAAGHTRDRAEAPFPSDKVTR